MWVTNFLKRSKPDFSDDVGKYAVTDLTIRGKGWGWEQRLGHTEEFRLQILLPEVATLKVSICNKIMGSNFNFDLAQGSQVESE